MAEPSRLPDLPQHRSFSPEPISRGVNIFQLAGQTQANVISVPTLVGVVASARGAPLGNTEFDVLTVMLRRFSEAGAPDDNVYVELRFRDLVKALYGACSGKHYRLVIEALRNLSRVEVTLPRFDADLGAFSANALSMVRLTREISVVGDVVGAMADNAITEFWTAFQGAAGKGDLNLRIHLEDWIAEAVRANDGRELNFDVQRSLHGTAKGIWVLLETSEFDQEPGDREHLTMLLDRETYKAFGLQSSRLTDCRAKLEGRLADILAEDPAYVEVRFEEWPRDRRRRVLTVVRATGGTRQARLRRALSERTSPRGADQPDCDAQLSLRDLDTNDRRRTVA